MKKFVMKTAALIMAAMFVLPGIVVHAAGDTKQGTVIEDPEAGFKVEVPEVYDYVLAQKKSYRGDLGSLGVDMNALYNGLASSHVRVYGLYYSGEYGVEAMLYSNPALKSDEIKSLSTYSDKELRELSYQAASELINGTQEYSYVLAYGDGGYRPSDDVAYYCVSGTYYQDTDEGTKAWNMYSMYTFVDGESYTIMIRTLDPDTKASDFKEEAQAFADGITYYNASPVEESEDEKTEAEASDSKVFTSVSTEVSEPLILSFPEKKIEVEIPKKYPYVIDENNSYRDDVEELGLNLDDLKYDFSYSRALCFYALMKDDQGYWLQSAVKGKESDGLTGDLRDWDKDDIEFLAAEMKGDNGQNIGRNAFITNKGIYNSESGDPYMVFYVSGMSGEEYRSSVYCTMVDGWFYYFIAKSFNPDADYEALNADVEEMIELANYTERSTVAAEDAADEEIAATADEDTGDAQNKQDINERIANLYFLAGKCFAVFVVIAIVITIIAVNQSKKKRNNNNNNTV